MTSSCILFFKKKILINLFVFFLICLKFGIGTLRKSVTMATKNVYLQFSNLKILLVPSYEKLRSFKVIAFPLWSSEPFTRLEVEKTPTPGGNRVKWMNLDEYQGLFVCKLFPLLAITLQPTD